MFDSHKIDAYFEGERPFDNAKTEDKPAVSGWHRLIKLGFPCLAAAILGLMLVMPNIKKSVDLQDNITVPHKNEMEKLHIEETVYYATDAKNRVSTITADSVDEVSPGAAEVKISNPRGNIPTDNGDIDIRADTGLFNQKSNVLNLQGNVEALHERGTKVTSQNAVYDFKAEYGYGNEHIKADGDWGNLEAAAFEFLKKENILVLKGKHIVTTGQGVLTAEKETRYFQDRHKSVSAGNVVVQQGDNILYADKLVAQYTPDNKLKKAEAFGNVRVVTPKGKAFGDKGVYNPETAKVKLFGKVRLEQDGNIINGNQAETDLNKQISRITANKNKGSRITGTFYSKRKKNNGKNAD